MNYTDEMISKFVTSEYSNLKKEDWEHEMIHDFELVKKALNFMNKLCGGKKKSTSTQVDNDALLGTVLKPPLGLMPKHIHDELRQGQLLEAMKRYIEARKAIPQEWIAELVGYCS